MLILRGKYRLLDFYEQNNKYCKPKRRGGENNHRHKPSRIFSPFGQKKHY